MSTKSTANSIRKSLREFEVDAVVSTAKPTETDQIREGLKALGVTPQVTN